MILKNIKSPKDLKKLTIDELKTCSDEIRNVLLQKMSNVGGHVGPNLGVVELTTALHYVFNSPEDKIVFDISHQSYTHKMLTGRLDGFIRPDKYKTVTGYSSPDESPHDFFTIGHTSTSISLALGLATARDLKKDNENIIAVIGDGSLSGGEAFEGLSNASENGTNMIIVVNDNNQSIAENHGGLYKNLKELRESNGTCSNNYFKALGLEYMYVNDGHDILELVNTFKTVKDITKPIVVHVHTIKGKGLEAAEINKEGYHYGRPFNLETGEYKTPKSTADNFMTGTGKYLLNKMKKDPKVAFITSATPTVAGFFPELRKEAGKQFIDVGIAEEHAVALASGMAKNGAKPVYGVYSTFLQRAYDQISQDLCINNNSAVILVYFASVFGMNDVTHFGIFDIPMLSNIPNLVYLAPTSKGEYFSMLDWAIEQDFHPVAIRVPVIGYEDTDIKYDTSYTILNKYQVTNVGKDVAIIGLGGFFGLAEQINDTLKGHDINATVINPRFITGLDNDVLDSLKEDHKIVITIEDGAIEGGFGEKISRYYGTDNMKVKNYGIKKEFYDYYVASELLRENGISVEQISTDIIELLKNN